MRDHAVRRLPVVTSERDDDGMTVTFRRADPDDAAAAADVFLRARHHAAAEGTIPPIVGDDDGARRYWTSVVEGEAETYLAFDGGHAIAVLSLGPGWVNHLYVVPGRTGAGVGTTLLDFAKQRSPGGLQLWAFQSNTGARRFYERHGFVDVERTDGRDNMEKAPDVRYVWSPSS
jgi:GNAT superfamily N-acetyltransferase